MSDDYSLCGSNLISSVFKTKDIFHELIKRITDKNMIKSMSTTCKYINYLCEKYYCYAVIFMRAISKYIPLTPPPYMSTDTIIKYNYNYGEALLDSVKYLNNFKYKYNIHFMNIIDDAKNVIKNLNNVNSITITMYKFNTKYYTINNYIDYLELLTNSNIKDVRLVFYFEADLNINMNVIEEIRDINRRYNLQFTYKIVYHNVFMYKTIDFYVKDNIYYLKEVYFKPLYSSQAANTTRIVNYNILVMNKRILYWLNNK